jgi:hypothetical protein
MSGHREVLVLGRLVVVQPVLPATVDRVHGVDGSGSPVELAARSVTNR